MSSQQQQRYHVLVIVTDGDAQDTEATRLALVAAAAAPLSIAIIGFGAADLKGELSESIRVYTRMYT